MYYPIKKDRRYTITKEYTGKAKPQYVIRFCNEWIDSRQFLNSAIVRAVGYDSERRGAMIIEALEA